MKTIVYCSVKPNIYTIGQCPVNKMHEEKNHLHLQDTTETVLAGHSSGHVSEAIINQ